MSISDQLSFDPEQFSGRVRLFPLPDLVLFPHVMQPLHVFEPRYVELLEEALITDRLLAMAVLAPGWEGDYEGRPPLAPVACLGRVATFQQGEGSRFNILLIGIKRVRIVRELPPVKLFREAEVEVLDDRPLEPATENAHLQRQLFSQFKLMLAQIPSAQEQLEQLLTTDIPLGMLTDIIGYTLDVGHPVKQQLLCEPDAAARARLLLQRLEELGAGAPAKRRAGYSAPFSDN